MSTITPDAPTVAPSRFAAGLGFALLSATSFGLSGALARGLIESGWTPAAAVTARVAIAALVLAVPSVMLLRGRWSLLVRNLRLVAAYGVVAVAGVQLAYFNAVMHMEVGVALLIEYAAPLVVVGWLWARHNQRPGSVTVTGAVLALAGLCLVLEVHTGVSASAVGLTWAFASMFGAAVYFILSADEGNGLPPLVLAGGGTAIGAVGLVVAGLVGLVPMRASTTPATYDALTGTLSMPWWAPVLLLGVVTAAVAYSTGIAASRRLGSRMASFVALSEVLLALVFAWLLLAEVPGLVQLVGGVLVLAGVVVVKLGERGTVS